MRDFDSALKIFNQLLTKYPQSNKIAGATLKLGFIYQERGQTAQATALLEQVINKFPDSTEAKLAQQRLKLIDR
jgi:TolA-binding protein